ncbi:MAG: fumarylacetoacetate hydrolase family protein [Sphingomonadaceae bacterium]|nr:fumarylacetoacetate hydrolase family protein [Sphingomonadaceae bacterium]
MTNETTEYLFAPPAVSSVPVTGTQARYPVHRIFCVGRNYLDHAKEMGVELDREAPFYFTKPASAIVQSGSTVPYPPGTANYHHEMELVIAMGGPAFRVAKEDVWKSIYALGCGLDMTRRDLQLVFRGKGQPWDLGKSFEQSAVMGALTPVSGPADFDTRRLTLDVNGERRQDALLGLLIWKVEEIVSHLSGFYHLNAGDLIYTGTPAGVGAVVAGDQLVGQIDGLEPVKLTIGPAE